MPFRIPPVPPGVGSLTDEAADRLDREYPSIPHPNACVTCGGSGTFTWRAPGETAWGEPSEWECDCIDQYLLHRNMLWSGIGLNYQRLTTLDAIDSVRDSRGWEWAENMDAYVRAGVGLILYGAIGNGKTLLANLLAKQAIRRGYQVYSTTFAAMIERFTAGWHSIEDKAFFQARIKNAPILLIDDVGREQSVSRKASDGTTDFTSRPLARTTIDETLRHRVASCQPTLITTNLSLDNLVQGYGSQVMSLLRERSLAVRFEGEDWRDEARRRLHEEITLGLSRPIMLDILESV